MTTNLEPVQTLFDAELTKTVARFTASAIAGGHDSSDYAP